MNAAAVLPQKRALFLSRFSEAHFVACAIHVFLLECFRRHADELRCAQQILFGKIHAAFLIAAVDATLLARKANTIH
jgi:hypothetical protein